MFFDMIGDQYGYGPAIICSSLLASIYPVMIFLSRNAIQPCFDTLYTKIELENPRHHQVKIDRGKFESYKTRVESVKNNDETVSNNKPLGKTRMATTIAERDSTIPGVNIINSDL